MVGSPESAGLDIASSESVSIPPGMAGVINTGLALRFPKGTYGHIFGRSGLSAANVDVAAGVIDPDFTGES
jgi:dUTP pyrophosphatase